MPVLYSFWASSCAWRVRIALKIVGLEVEHRAVNLRQKENHQTEFGDKNPMKQVPCLVIDGMSLGQSMAILEYINDISGGKLLPLDIKLRAKVRMICEMINSGIQPLQNSGTLFKYSDQQNERDDWANHFISKGLAAVEKVLEGTAGGMCVGNEVTLADICLIPQLANAIKYKCDMSLYPTIMRINDNLKNRPEFVSASPARQADAPPEMKSKQ